MEGVYIITAAVLAAAAFLVIFVPKRLLRCIVPGEKVIAVVVASGKAETIERTLRTLCRLRNCAGMNLTILVADEGMDAESMRIVQLCAKENEFIAICAHDDTSEAVESFICR